MEKVPVWYPLSPNSDSYSNLQETFHGPKDCYTLQQPKNGIFQKNMLLIEFPNHDRNLDNKSQFKMQLNKDQKIFDFYQQDQKNLRTSNSFVF